MSTVNEEMKTVKCWRQGEVLFERIALNGGMLHLKELVEANSSIHTRDNGILAEGEVTGHMHEVIGEKGKDYELYDVSRGDSDRETYVSPGVSRDYGHPVL